MVQRVTIHVSRDGITNAERTFAKLDQILTDVGIDFRLGPMGGKKPYEYSFASALDPNDIYIAILAAFKELGQSPTIEISMHKMIRGRLTFFHTKNLAE